MTQIESKKLTIAAAVKNGAAILKRNEIDNADYDSFALLSQINGMDRTYYYTHGNDELPASEYERFMDNIKKRSEHIPLQHILGKAYFYGHEFIVNSHVLVPRSDTETLVEQVISATNSDSSILDMCTGSGCIILSLALEKHLSVGVGVDISTEALEVAMQNKENLNVDHVKFIKSNLFENEKLKKNYFDVIVSNPPYIRSDVIPTLSKEVRLHDPMIALDGFEDGLHFYRNITKQAPVYLKAGGWLMYEIGYDQAEDVSRIMQEHGFGDIDVVKDLSGLDRVVRGRLI